MRRLVVGLESVHVHDSVPRVFDIFLLLIFIFVSFNYIFFSCPGNRQYELEAANEQAANVWLNYLQVLFAFL